MSDKSKIIAVLATIVIPVIAFLGGMYSQHLISEKALQFQQFSTATNLVVTDAVKKDEGLRTWAEKTIREYTKVQKQVEPVPLASSDFYIVSKEIADSVCLFPRETLQKVRSITDGMKSREGLKVGDEFRVAYFRVLADWVTLADYYDFVTSSLDRDCGFLKRQD